MKKLKNKVNQILKSCNNCQYNKYSQNGNFAELQTIETNAPNEILSMDFYGPLPESTARCKHLLVTIDTFSKFVKLYSMVKAKAKNVVYKLTKDYIPKYGKPSRILLDHGTQFTSDTLINELNELNIKYTHVSIRHPCTNIVERTNKELGRFFSIVIKK